MNPSIRMSGESSMARMAGMMVTWLQKTEKLRIPSALARIKVSAVEGAVVSKPMAKNMTCFRDSSGQLRAHRWRIDDADIHAAGFVFERAAVVPGTRIMSPKAAKITSGSLRDGEAVVDASHGKDADRTAGAVNQFDIGGKDVFQAEAVDGVGVAAADFHDAVLARGVGEAANFFRGPGNQLGSRNSSTKSQENFPGAIAISSLWRF